MDLSLQLLVFFLGLRLVIAETLNVTSSSSTTSSKAVASTSTNVFAPLPTTSLPRKCPEVQTASLKLVLARVARTRQHRCKGAVHLRLPGELERPFCIESPYKSRLTELCQQMTCGSFQAWEASALVNGLFVDDNGTVTHSKCLALHIKCKEGYSGELAAYKAVTGLLLVLVLTALLARFGKPTYSAIRKRLSQKRQTRWIGPTQSQSVYYHRDQAGGTHPNSTSKRHSYPALEKLTVTASREPSSNRNSDYSYN